MDYSSLNPLDSNDINIEEYYKSYIKNKSIDELINQDNKVFAGRTVY
jgi:retron-type reverse transcriptase